MENAKAEIVEVPAGVYNGCLQPFKTRELHVDGENLGVIPDDIETPEEALQFKAFIAQFTFPE